MKLKLHTIALKIFKICYEHSIHLNIEWVPRDRNARADFISKLVNFDDWQVTEDVLNKGTLIVPLWKSAVFWPLLTNIYCSFIQDFCLCLNL